MPHATTIEWPNREKASSKLMRALMVLAVLASSFLVVLVSVLGWDLMQEVKLVQIIFVAINLIFVVQIVRWSRGVLPMAAGIATLLAIFSAISIPSWYARDAPGFDHASLSATIGLLTILIFVVQLVVIVFSIVAFTQNWQIEVERHDEPQNGTGRPGAGGRRHGGAATA